LHKSIPWPLLLLLGGWLLAWQGSLQHETIHGRPTRWRHLNSLIGSPPLSLWLPYARYRETHMAHHASKDLTRPTADPESRYLTRRVGSLSAIEHTAAHFASTLFGRLTLGPFIEVSIFLSRECKVLATGDRKRWMIWAVHGLQVAMIVTWLTLVCHMSLLLYAAIFIYPATALALLRSFAEHRAAELHGHRIAIVENAPVLGLLFLNNNLHAVHHRHPGAPWAQLPRLYRRERSEILSANGGLVYAGYGEIVRRFLFAPHDKLLHPDEAATSP